MKKSIFLVGLFLLTNLMANAQMVVDNYESEQGFIPAGLTTDSKAKFYVIEGLSEKGGGADMGIAHIYDASLIEISSFQIKHESYVGYERREREPIPVLVNKYFSDSFYNYTGYKEWLEGADSMYVDEDGRKIYIMEYYYKSQYGKKYPSSGFYRIWSDYYDEEVIAVFEFEYQEKYDGDWIEEQDRYYIDDIGVEFNDLTNPNSFAAGDGGFGYITQTLFNTDSKYEYLHPRYTLKEEIEEEDRDGDGDVDYICIHRDTQYQGMDVLSEDGSVVLSYTFEQPSNSMEECSICIFEGGQKYIFFYLYDWDDMTDDDRSVIEIHTIGSNSSQITRVTDNNTLMRLLPAMARKNTTVTVELNEEAAKNGGQLMVSDMSGRIVYRTTVSAGESSIRVPLNRMNSGVYNVVLLHKGTKIENSKLIIK